MASESARFLDTADLRCYIRVDIIRSVKPVTFLGDSLKALRDFPNDARHDAGYQLHKLQSGEMPDDFKPVPSIGKGVEELRVWSDEGTFRVIYLARRTEAVYVLHAFHKKARATPRAELELARNRFAALQRTLR